MKNLASNITRHRLLLEGFYRNEVNEQAIKDFSNTENLLVRRMAGINTLLLVFDRIHRIQERGFYGLVTDSRHGDPYG